MDLIERDLHQAANIVLNRYLADTQRIYDLDALAALPLFMSTRAAIRAKVTAARLRQTGSQAELTHGPRDYAALAQKLLLPGKPRLVAIGGLSGTGKSLLARALAPRFHPLPGAVVLRSDVERKALLGAAETDKLPESAYTTAATAKVYAALTEKARRAVSAGHSVIVDAVFARQGERDEIAKIAPDAFEGIFLTAKLETRLARVSSRSGDASDADAITARRQEEFDLGNIKWAKVDASDTPEETFIRAEAMLEQR
jgi:uncharacterized protein